MKSLVLIKNMKKKLIEKIKNNKSPNFVIFRTDRIGDTVLSLHTAELLKKQYPTSHITFVLKNYTKALAGNNPFIDNIVPIDNYSIHDLVRFLKVNKFDAAIVLYSRLKIAWAIFKAKIPVRIGPMSKWWGIFYNFKIWQKRSSIKKNEAEYNVELVNVLGVGSKAYPKIYLDEGEKNRAKGFVEQYKGNKKLIIIHPGSGHSAKNWPLENFLALAEMLSTGYEGVRVILTGNEKETSVYKYECESFNFSEDDIVCKKDLRDFISLVSIADCVVTNSTGPLHIAAALNIPTISFFCPVRVCSPKRWGPYSQHSEEHTVMMPDADQCEKCIAAKCKFYNCMEKIEITDVLKILERKNIL
ncbi:glycosyltransferase family 9 protein [bacterium]